MEGLKRWDCVSAECNMKHYNNPVAAVAAIYIKDGRILLGKRKGSYAGLWCIPCGYVDYAEDVRVAVRREFKEETNLEVTAFSVYDVHSNFHNPKQFTVGIFFTILSAEGELKAMDDLDEVGFFNFQEIQALNLAFPTDRIVLRRLKSELVLN